MEIQEINRNNYEEFFLLYIDGELDEAGRKGVENFVQQNPDLAIELQLFQDAVLQPEPSIIFDKSFLLKSENGSINSANCDEKFCLYIDNELTVTEQKEVETYVLQHPNVQESFTQLKQTKLPIDTISCPQKDKLYKNEERRRVVYMNWLKMSAAAAVIGLGFYWYGVATLPNSKNSVAIQNDGNDIQQPLHYTPRATTPAPTNDDAFDDSDKTDEKNEEAGSVAHRAVNHEAVEAEIINQMMRNRKKNNQLAALPKDKAANTNIKNIPANNQLPIKDSQALVSNRHISPKALEKLQEMPAAPSNSNAVTHSVVNNDKTTTTQNTVVYKQLDVNDESKSLVLGNVEINKDKLRGLLRRASKVLKTNRDSEKESNMAIASFSIYK